MHATALTMELTGAYAEEFGRRGGGGIEEDDGIECADARTSPRARKAMSQAMMSKDAYATDDGGRRSWWEERGGCATECLQRADAVGEERAYARVEVKPVTARRGNHIMAKYRVRVFCCHTGRVCEVVFSLLQRLTGPAQK